MYSVGRKLTSFRGDFRAGGDHLRQRVRRAFKSSRDLGYDAGTGAGSLDDANDIAADDDDIDVTPYAFEGYTHKFTVPIQALEGLHLNALVEKLGSDCKLVFYKQAAGSYYLDVYGCAHGSTLVRALQWCKYLLGWGIASSVFRMLSLAYLVRTL